MAASSWAGVLLAVLTSPFRLVYNVFSLFGWAIWTILSILLLPVSIPLGWLYGVLVLLFHIATELQTLLAFVGSAIVVGMASGVVIYFLSNSLISLSFGLLQLEDSVPEDSAIRSPSTFREQRRKKRSQHSKTLIKSEPSDPDPASMESLEKLAQELLAPYTRGEL